MAQNPPGASALKFVVLLGVVSLFADMTYEGARSITGPFLALLGASGTAVGLIAGLGELIGYSLRLASGYLADRTGRVLGDYPRGLRPEHARRASAGLGRPMGGRGCIDHLRTNRQSDPHSRAGRDAITRNAPGRPRMGVRLARGVGPSRGGCGAAGRRRGPGRRRGIPERHSPCCSSRQPSPSGSSCWPDGSIRGLATSSRSRRCAMAGGSPRVFWLYLAAAALVAAGYADFPLIAYHFGKTSVVTQGWIPVFYAVAMGVDALAALAFGHFFDRFGLATLVVAVVGSAFFAPLVFLGGFYPALVGMILWGIGMGAQESILRAAIATMIPRDRRGIAYGLFNTGFGLAWFAGSAVMGMPCDTSLTALTGFSVIIQLFALPLLSLVTRRAGGLKRGAG